MSDAFSFSRNDNFFGSTAVPLENALDTFPLDCKDPRAPKPFDGGEGSLGRLYGAPWLPLRLRVRLWHTARRTEFDHSWFAPFARYWSGVLKGRPLWDVHDFYFLRSFYRLAFQNLQVPPDATAVLHEAAYQRPDALYFLFHQVYKEKIAEHARLIARLLKHGGGRISSLLEYGCGTAPFATSLLQFFTAARAMKIYLSDLRSLPLQYAAYKFRGNPSVSVFPLLPDANLQLGAMPGVDVVVCLTVFEHLNEPLTTVHRFDEILNPGGLLVFDYIKGDAGGLDTGAGQYQRGEVLSFIRNRFQILEGRIETERSVGTTICRKRG